jgi:hypothetical protein
MGDCNCKGRAHGSSAVCVECDIPQLARNNYFTGKLLVERDFTDEQHYFMGKERRHNQRLHGWGAACGLRVSAHPNPACADRFVLVDPGTAIDCCGREILVRHQECFDFEARYLDQWQAQNGPASQPDAKPVDLQICVSYKECATEDVPALFDDCSSESSSKPNRIVESYGFDVLVKPKNAPAENTGVKLTWSNTLNFADALRVTRHGDTKRIYILTSNTTTAVLYALDSDTESVLMPPQTFTGSAGLDLAVSPAGDFVYVALQSSAAGSAPEISVRKAADLSEANHVSIGSAADPKVRIAATPDGRIISIGSVSGVLVWDTSINTSVSAAGTAVSGISNPVDVAVSADGQFAYVVATGTNNVSAIALASSSLPVTAIPIGSAPSAVAVADTTAGSTLAVLDGATLYLVGLPTGPSSPNSLGSVTGFANPPIGVQMSPGGRWTYVLEQDAAGKVYVQSADAHAVQTGSGTVLGGAVAVGVGTASETIIADGSELYIPYRGTATTPGAIAVVDIAQASCPDLFREAIEPCPDCTDGNCIVLATIKGYVYGSPVTGTQIDNLTDRHILASTSLLTDVVRCLLDQGGGSGIGLQGPPGPPGKDGTNGTNGTNGAPGLPGLGIDQVSVTFVPCGQDSASITGTSPSRTLVLKIPGDCNKDLTGIAGVTWDHNGNSLSSLNVLRSPGLGIAFSGPVQAADLTANSLFLLVPQVTGGLTVWAEAQLTIAPGNFATIGDVTSAFTASTSAQVDGVMLTLDVKTLRQLEELQPAKLRVVVKGDFIRDASANLLAIDGDHLPPWLPKRRTGDGITGGTFESWFLLKQ